MISWCGVKISLKLLFQLEQIFISLTGYYEIYRQTLKCGESYHLVRRSQLVILLK